MGCRFARKAPVRHGWEGRTLLVQLKPPRQTVGESRPLRPRRPKWPRSCGALFGLGDRAFEMCESGYRDKRSCNLLRNPARGPIDDRVPGRCLRRDRPPPMTRRTACVAATRAGGASGAAVALLMLCRSRCGRRSGVNRSRLRDAERRAFELRHQGIAASRPRSPGHIAARSERRS
jgi:hypothetical protein